MAPSLRLNRRTQQPFTDPGKMTRALVSNGTMLEAGSLILATRNPTISATKEYLEESARQGVLVNDFYFSSFLEALGRDRKNSEAGTIAAHTYIENSVIPAMKQNDVETRLRAETHLDQLITALSQAKKAGYNVPTCTLQNIMTGLVREKTAVDSANLLRLMQTMRVCGISPLSTMRNDTAEALLRPETGIEPQDAQATALMWFNELAPCSRQSIIQSEAWSAWNEAEAYITMLRVLRDLGAAPDFLSEESLSLVSALLSNPKIPSRFEPGRFSGMFKPDKLDETITKLGVERLVETTTQTTAAMQSNLRTWSRPFRNAIVHSIFDGNNLLEAMAMTPSLVGGACIIEAITSPNAVHAVLGGALIGISALMEGTILFFRALKKMKERQRHIEEAMQTAATKRLVDAGARVGDDKQMEKE